MRGWSWLCAVLLLSAFAPVMFAQVPSIEYTHTAQNPLPHLYAVLRGERLLALTITPGLTQTETWIIGESSPSAQQQRLFNASRGVR